MRKFFTIYASCMLLASMVFAQDVMITGTVTDQQTGDALIGANVLVKGTSKGTITDVSGKYTIEAPAQSTLVFSYIGFIDQEVAIGNRSVIDLSMQPDLTQLSEVVVTALGVSRETRTIGYSAEKVEGKQLTETNESNVLNSLKGRVAGVQISDGNGVSGGTTRITIRGNSSLINGKNQPLIVVDGVQIENSITGPGSNTMTSNDNGKDWGSGINNINPWDIEEMTVLKGPNAAALYGSRGSNGVIVITTKKGKKSKGLGLDFSINHMTTQAYGFRDVQNQRGAGTSGSYENQVIPNINGNGYEQSTIDGTTYNLIPATNFWGSGTSWGHEMDGTDVLWWDGEVRPYSPQPDNLESFFQNGHDTNYNLAFSGASDVGSMRVSITHNDVEAITPNTTREQNTINLNSSLNVSSKVRADIAISYMNNNMLNSPHLGNSEASIGKNLTYNWDRGYNLELEKDRYQFADGSRAPGGQGRPGVDQNAGYPNNWRGYGRPGSFYWNLWNNNTELDRNRVMGSIGLTYDITDWLMLKGTIGMDYQNEEVESRNKPTDTEGLTGGRYSHTMRRNTILNNTVMLRVKKDITESLSLTAFVGGESWDRDFYQIQGDNANRNFADPFIYAFRNIDYPVDANNNVTVNWARNQLLPGEDKYEKRVNSAFASVNLAWKDWLYLDITGRNDWSSTLPSETRSYFYPSVQSSFVFTDALQLNTDILTFGKVRAAFAQAGNDTEPYQVTPTYNRNSFGGQEIATVNATIPPTTLRSELSNSWEIGADLRFFEGRINLDATYYAIRSENQILQSPVPRSSGFTSLRFNSGVIENKGYELLLSGTPIKTNDFSWEVAFNMNANQNEVVSLADGAETLNLGGVFGNNGPSIEARPGEGYGTIMGWDYVYHDTNGNEMTDPSEKVSSNRLLTADGRSYITTQDRVPVGNTIPSWTGGLVNTFTYKSLTLNAVLDIRQGGDVMYGSMSSGLGYGQSPQTLKGWGAENGGLAWTDDNAVSRNDGVILEGVLDDGSVNNTIVPYYREYQNVFSWGPGAPVSPLVHETSWVRLQQVALTYDFPRDLLSGTFIQNASITLVGRDLLYFQNTAPDNLDPAGVNGAGNSQGIEWGSLPIARSYGGSIRIGF